VASGSGGVNGGGRGLRFELEDAEVHRRDEFVRREPGAPGGDEVALAERGALGAGDVEEPAPDGQLLTELEVAGVGLVAVGGDHRGAAGFVEYLVDQAQGVVAGAGA